MKRNTGFTLVEILTVIVIISILAGLITAAAMAALKQAHEMVIVTEVTQLDMAMKMYKQQHGDYPPDFCGINDPDPTIQARARESVLRHLRKAFPRYHPGVSGSTATDPWDRFRDDVLAGTDNRLDVNKMTPAGALVFWLGGLPSDVLPYPTRLVSFSSNAANPFQAGGTRLKPLFEFDEERLARSQSDEPFEYLPAHTDGEAPYVYFRARSYAYTPTQTFTGNGTVAVPYGKDGTIDESTTPPTVSVTKWCRHQNYQIISAGLDGLYSAEIEDQPYTTRTVLISGDPAGALGGISDNDFDNITNFSEGRLGDWNPCVR